MFGPFLKTNHSNQDLVTHKVADINDAAVNTPCIQRTRNPRHKIQPVPCQNFVQTHGSQSHLLPMAPHATTTCQLPAKAPSILQVSL
jgi:hypothetical protein